MNILKIKLSHKDHPFPNELESSFEAWGSVYIEVYNADNFKVLKQVDWDILNLLEWFANNRKWIASEEFLVLGERAIPEESLSQALYRIRLQKFLHPQNIPDDLLDQLSVEYEGYYQRHSLLTEMKGSGMPEIIIGLNHGVGEISLLSKSESWKYQFNMDVFINDFTHETMEFVSKWQEQTQNERKRKRGLDILRNLRD